MKEIKASEVKRMLENQNVVNCEEFTFGEYIEQLTSFQKIVSAFVFEGDDSYRLSDSITQLQQLIRNKELKDNHFVQEALRSLRNVNKELAIIMAGKKGEERIEKALSFVQRSDLKVYKNVYITDGKEETELDMVLVTNNGIIILEIKNAKQDITISKDGRILYDNETSYHNACIGEKMDKKRRLLRYRIEQELKQRGVNLLDKPIKIESCITFSTQYNTHITVTDLYKKERFCYRGQLTKQIEDYYSGTCYESEDLRVLNDILDSMESNKKRFQQKLDFSKINNEFAQLMEMLTKPDEVEPAERMLVVTTETTENVVTPTTAVIRRKSKNHKFGKFAIPAASAVLLLAGIVSSAVISKRN